MPARVSRRGSVTRGTSTVPGVARRGVDRPPLELLGQVGKLGKHERAQSIAQAADPRLIGGGLVGEHDVAVRDRGAEGIDVVNIAGGTLAWIMSGRHTATGTA